MTRVAAAAALVADPDADTYIEIPLRDYDDVLVMVAARGIAVSPSGSRFDVTLGAGYSASFPSQAHRCIARAGDN